MKTIFEKMLKGGIIKLTEEGMNDVWEVVFRTQKLTPALNNSLSISEIRKRLSEIIEKEIDQTTTIFTPFHTNFGIHISLGKNVFINHDCTFLDLGGITIEDDVQIGPKVSLITENHPINPNERKSLDLAPVHIKRNVWIGAGAIILPGVTVGENSVVAAGAVVNKNVPDNVVVAGVPAKILKNI